MVDVRDGSRVAHEEEGRNTMLAYHALRALIIGSTIMSAAAGMAGRAARVTAAAMPGRPIRRPTAN